MLTSPILRLHLAPLAAAILLGAVATPARAGLISVNTAVLSANGAEITTLGRTVSAWNVNGNAVTAPTINGVTFYNAQPSNITISAGFTASVQNSLLTDAHYSAPMNELMNDMLGTNANGSATLTFSNLVAGVLYQAQFLHHQDTNQSLRTMRVHFGGTVTPSLTDNSDLFLAGNNDGYITTFLFTADSTTQTFLFNTSGGSNRAILNGVALTVIPEPGTLLLAALGLAGFAVRLRRARRSPA